MSKALPVSWVEVPLGELGTWVGGGTPSKSNPLYWVGGKIPWVSPKDMKLEVIGDAADHITAGAVDGSSSSIVAAGSVLVVVRSGILRHSLPVAVAAVDVALNQDMKALTPPHGLDARYIAWTLRRFEQEILHTCTKAGTTVESVEMPRFSAFSIPVAPLAEQRRIVAAIEEHLSRLDAAVAGLKRVQAQLPRYRAAVLKAAVEGRLVGDADLSEWPKLTIGEVGSIVTGSTPATANQSQYGGTIPFFKPSDLDAGYNTFDAAQHLSEHGLAKARAIPAMSVMVTCIGATIGKTGLARRAGATNQQINTVVPHAHVDARFLYWWFRSPAGQEAIAAQASATTLPILNKTRFSQLQLRLPSLSGQETIVAEIDRRVSLADALQLTIESGVVRAERARQSILARAFSGQLVSQDPNDEPASVLLERIRAGRARQAAQNGKGRGRRPRG